MATAGTTATGRTRSDALFAAVSLATALPLLFVRYLPFTDLPEHVAAIATFARMLPVGGGAPEYVFAGAQSQYLLYDLAGALLARLLGDAVLANRVLLTAIAIAWPFALRSLLRALGRDDRVAILAPATFWNRALTLGFLPFVASVPLAIFALATFVRQLEAPTRRRALLVGAFGLASFYTHVSTFVVFAVTAGVMALARRRVAALLPLVPGALAALWWWRAGSLAARATESGNVGRLPGHRSFDAVPLWAFDVWRGHLDEVAAALWWTAFGLFAVAGLKRKPDLRASAFALAPLACAAAIYLVTPFHVGPAGYLDVRLAPMLALFVIVALHPDREAPPWQTRAPTALAAIAAVLTAFTAAREMMLVEREMLGDFDALLAQMRPQTRLALLNFDQRSPRTYFWPYVLAGSYHRAKPGTIVSYSFSEIDHWPLHYAPGIEAPPVHPGFWHYTPCMFELRRDGAYYDYVLVQGARSPFLEGQPGPTYREIARSGAFLLFEKASNEDKSAGVPDASPCARIGPPEAR